MGKASVVHRRPGAIGRAAPNFKPVPIGAEFGKLVHVGEAPRTHPEKRRVYCECTCGSGRSDHDLSDLRQGKVTHCGCSPAPKGVQNHYFVGQRIGNMEIVEIPPHVPNTMRKAVFRCDFCGEDKLAIIAVVNRPRTRSCGCQRRKHGESQTRLHKAWRGMIERCDPVKGHKDYGLRGIRVCDAWHEYTVFAEWARANNWRHGLQLDRVDTNGDYEPSNVQVVTPSQNAQNRRQSVRWFVGDREFGRQIDAASYIGVSPVTLWKWFGDESQCDTPKGVARKVPKYPDEHG